MLHTFFIIFLILGHIICPRPSIWQSADGRVTADHCRVTVQWLFSKCVLIAWNVQKTLFDSRLTVACSQTTVAWTVQWLFSKFLLITWNFEKALFDCRATVAWPPSLRPLSRDRLVTFFKQIYDCQKRFKNVVWLSVIDCYTRNIRWIVK